MELSPIQPVRRKPAVPVISLLSPTPAKVSYSPVMSDEIEVLPPSPAAAKVERKESVGRRFVKTASGMVFEFTKHRVKIASRKASKGDHIVADLEACEKKMKKRKTSKASLKSFSELDFGAFLSKAQWRSSRAGKRPSLAAFKQNQPPGWYDLPEKDRWTILNYMSGESLLLMSQCNRELRLIARDPSKYSRQVRERFGIELRFDIPKFDGRELMIRRNRETNQDELRASLHFRSYKTTVVESERLGFILPAIGVVYTKIVFCDGVDVKQWVPVIEHYYQKGKLVPTGFHFTGGAATKGLSLFGADLRGFTQDSFLDWISKYSPHVHEVQLSTTRLFKTTTTPPRLLSMISIVREFGVLYERPALRFQFQDLKTYVMNWRHSSRSQPHTLYTRRPVAAVADWYLDATNVHLEKNGQVSEITVLHSANDNRLVVKFIQ